MARESHDQLVKGVLAPVLQQFGSVLVGEEVGSEVQRADVSFAPRADALSQLRQLGLLGRLADRSCIFEGYRRPPTADQLRDAISKTLQLHQSLRRAERRRSGRRGGVPLPRLVVIAPVVPARQRVVGRLEALRGRGWPAGVFTLAPLFGTLVVAANELPRSEETLWLRLLGSGRTQAQAFRELFELRRSGPAVAEATDALWRWMREIIARPRRSRDEEEVLDVMSSFEDELLEQGRQQGLAQGIQQGVQKGVQQGKREGKREGKLEGKLETIQQLLDYRFGGSTPAITELLGRIRTEAAATHAFGAALAAADRGELEDALRKVLLDS
jgi:hypothetical protein